MPDYKVLFLDGSDMIIREDMGEMLYAAREIQEKGFLDTNQVAGNKIRPVCLFLHSVKAFLPATPEKENKKAARPGRSPK